MSPLPFSRLLDLLRARGLPLGVREHVAFAALWQRLDGASVAELRGATAALLSTSPEELQLVAAAFDELYGEPPPEPPPPPPPTPPRWWTRLARLLWSATTVWALGAILVVAAALGVWFLTWWNAPLPTPAPAVLAMPVPFEAPREPEPRIIPPAPPLPPPPRALNWWLLAPALAVTAMAALVAFQRPRARAAERKGRARAWRQARSDLRGPTTFVLQPASPLTWFDRRDLEDAATLLSRAFTTGLTTTRLDVARTVRLTIAGGGLPRFVFEASSATGTLLLLEDVAPEMEAWRLKSAAFVAALARQGIRLDRWTFDGTPGLVSRDSSGDRVTLEQLARRSVSTGVLVISSGSGLAFEAADSSAIWRDALGSWSRRSWLNPVVSPVAWRPEMATLPTNVWPFTGDGVLDAAADLAVDPDGRRARAAKVTAGTTVLADDVERLKRLVAVAGHPGLELAEALRRRFIPDTPDDTLLWVLRDAAPGAPREVRLPAAEVRRLVAAERRANPERERAVRRHVLDLLATQAPPAGSVAALRWQLELATQRLALAQIDGTDQGAARDTLQRLAQGPIWEEAAEAMHGITDLATGRAPRAPDVERQPEPPAALPDGAVRPAASLAWLGPRPLELAVAAVFAALVAAGLQAGGVVGGAAIDHVADAYRLDFAPAPGGGGELSIARGPDAPLDVPATVQIYRDGQPFGEPLQLPAAGAVERTLAVADAGHHFQARAVLPRGNLALSESAWVAAPAQALAVSVNALPWAVTRVLAADGRTPVATSAFTTPFVVSLPPGRYVLEFSHPGYDTTVEPVEVQPGRPAAVVRVVMRGYDAAATAQRLMPQGATAR